MTPDERADKLAWIAAQMVTMVRDEDPTRVHEWLRGEMVDEDWCALAVVLACAVPDDKPWAQLTEWTRTPGTTKRLERRLRMLVPCGTPGAVKRHRDAGERLCDPCATWVREYQRAHRAQGSAQVVDDVGMVA